MKYLIVAAHPDDEVLGAGGTVAKLCAAGDTVELCVLCTKAQARHLENGAADIPSELSAVGKAIGIGKIYAAEFPNIAMNTVPHLQLVQLIESAIAQSGADVVITHHPSDTNDDHVHTSSACREAFRISQRRADVKPIAELWYMEVLSSTEWSLDSSVQRFCPNLFVELTQSELARKVELLSMYSGALRDKPHPRSRETIFALATLRGAQAGYLYAEAFECVFRRK